MDGHSCCVLEGVSAVAPSDGTSSDNTGGSKTPLEKHCALIEGTSSQAEDADNLLEAGMSMDFSTTIGLGVKKGFQKCATFPASAGEAEQEYSSSCDSPEGPDDAPTYERSVSLPPTLKLIPAMKGSRQKNGMISPTESRHVKWAPDVYDPPVTSVCHSVNSSSQHRSKSRKKDKNKQKQKEKQKEKQKARSKKKHQNGTQSSAVLQPPVLNDAEASNGSSALDDLDKHETEMLDYGTGSQEAKCGSSFLRETVAKVHFSTAEAS